MKFQPKTKKEIEEMNLLPEGEYPFEISQGLDKTSKIKPDGSGGNEMIELLVRVYRENGTFLLVNDYLLESMAYKLRHAAEACELLTNYETGVLTASDFVGKTGRLKLRIQKDKAGQFPDKNVISDYIVPKDGDVQAPLPKVLEKPFEDEIPF